jgi:peptidoglycan/xylan/chitin deacetylase (PgdA/CDA1 family)
MGFTSVLHCFLLCVCLLSLVDGKRKWDKLDPEIKFFYPGGHYIMLTFNDAIHESLTPKLLDMLKQRMARVTLFVQGNKVGANKDLVIRAVAERHEIANYGWDLSVETTSPSDEEIIDQVVKTSNAVESVVGKKTSVYRPPSTPAKAFKYESRHAGLLSEGGPQHQHHHQVILHSLDGDAGGTITTVNDLESKLMGAKKGDVIMCTLSAEAIDATARFIDKFMEEGYEFLTLSEMMSFPDDKPHR